MKFLKIPLLFSLTLLLQSCLKTEIGFLSQNIKYRPNPFVATQGAVTTSIPPETDGSTMPVSFKLISIINKATGRPADDLLVEKEIQVFTGNVTGADSTLEKLNAKLGTKKVKPFNIASIGGRLEISQASAFVDTGAYQIDIEVSNVKGNFVINNAVELKIIGKKHSEIISSSVTSSLPNDETIYTAITEGFPLTILHNPTGPNKIILKIVDKNNQPFNPRTGQIMRRADRPNFADLSPFYTEEKTDTALVFQYPTVPYPLFTNAEKYGNSFNNYSSYYRIPYTANNENLNFNPVFAFRVFSTGTWTITGRIPVATVK